MIPSFCVDAVCDVPYGSYPGNMPYEYFSDEEHLQEWLREEEDPARCLAFFDRLLFSTRDFDEYLDRSGARDRLPRLRELELNPTS